MYYLEELKEGWNLDKNHHGIIFLDFQKHVIYYSNKYTFLLKYPLDLEYRFVCLCCLINEDIVFNKQKINTRFFLQ